MRAPRTLAPAAAVGLAAALALAGPRPPAADVVQVGDVAPEIGGEWIQSAAESLADLRGRVVLIEFWRTW
jgi:hypothetical protein